MTQLCNAYAVLFNRRHFDQELSILCVRWYLPYKLRYRNLKAIVGMQMTKTGLLAARTGWQHIANFHMLIGDDNAVNQDLDQLPLLSKGRLHKAGTDALAEVLQRAGHGLQLYVSLYLRAEKLASTREPL